MTHRVNVMLDDAAWNVLQKFPKGERSKIVSSAIAEWDRVQQRISAAQRMDAFRNTLPEISTDEIVTELRRDRRRVE